MEFFFVDGGSFLLMGVMIAPSGRKLTPSEWLEYLTKGIPVMMARTASDKAQDSRYARVPHWLLALSSLNILGCKQTNRALQTVSQMIRSLFPRRDSSHNRDNLGS